MIRIQLGNKIKNYAFTFPGLLNSSFLLILNNQSLKGSVIDDPTAVGIKSVLEIIAKEYRKKIESFYMGIRWLGKKLISDLCFVDLNF